MPRVQLADRARQDLRDIRRYSKDRFGAQIAMAYLEGLRGAVKRLGRQPEAGSAQEQLGPGLRKLTYRSHAIYYAVCDPRVLVVRILHQAQDAPANLPRP